MTENQDLSKYTRTDKTACWVLNDDNQIVWRETIKVSKFDLILREFILDKNESKTVDKMPLEAGLGLTKSAEFEIIFVSEIPSMKKANLKEKLLFRQKVKAKIKSDYPNIYLVLSDSNKRFYIKDIERGVTYQMPLESNEYITVTKSEEERTTLEDAKIVLSKYGYLFGEVMEDNNETVYRQDVK